MRIPCQKESLVLARLRNLCSALLLCAACTFKVDSPQVHVEVDCIEVILPGGQVVTQCKPNDAGAD